MISDLLYYPMFTHVVWAMFLYALLTVARAPSVWRIGAKEDGTNPWATVERRISANLSNQFEWPLFFYVVCLLSLHKSQTIDSVQVWLAWLFIGGRLLHSGIQILTTNVRLRGIVFTINFLAVLGMWVRLLFVN